MAEEDKKEETSAEESAEEKTEAKAEEETKTEEKVEEKAVEAKPEKKEKGEAKGKYAELIKQIEKLSVLELSELVKDLEERFGVSAAAPMAMAPAAGAGAPAEAAEEKTSFTVVLKASGDQKIAAIKAVREVRSDLGLKEAKDLVDGAPKDVLVNAKKADAEEAKKKLEAAGATVELK